MWVFEVNLSALIFNINCWTTGLESVPFRNWFYVNTERTVELESHENGGNNYWNDFVYD